MLNGVPRAIFNRFTLIGNGLALILWAGLAIYERRRNRQRLEKFQNRIAARTGQKRSNATGQPIAPFYLAGASVGCRCRLQAVAGARSVAGAQLPALGYWCRCSLICIPLC